MCFAFRYIDRDRRPTAKFLGLKFLDLGDAATVVDSIDTLLSSNGLTSEEIKTCVLCIICFNCFGRYSLHAEFARLTIKHREKTLIVACAGS